MAATKLSRLSALLLAASSLTLPACGTGEQVFDQFDGPVDIAYLAPGTFFEVPVGFVSNFRSGRVAKLDLKRTTALVEDGATPWIGGPDIAFGREHTLGAIALAVTSTTVDVWVADDWGGQLLRAPYIAGLDESDNPIWSRPSLGELRSYEADGTAASSPVASLRGLRLEEGRATSERWTFTWDGHSFEVRGTASGLQRQRAVPGTPYVTDAEELRFTPSIADGAPSLGAYLELDVEFGIESAEAGGLVTDLRASAGGSWIFVTVVPDEGDGFVAVWDAVGFSELARLDLGPGARPERVGEGKDVGSLWIADSVDDSGFGRVHELSFVDGDLASLSLRSITVPEPAFEIVESQDPSVSLLFVASAFSDAIWAVSPVDGAVQDINPITPEPDPTYVTTIVAGLEAARRPVETTELDEDGTRKTTYGIFATTFGGELYFIDGATGCQVFGTPARAYADFSAAASTSNLFSDVGFESSPQLFFDAGGETVVSTHPCGGITKSEIWTLTYSELEQSYEVEGTRSGLQERRLFEGERYVSDEGAISLLILPGIKPTTDGDSWTFSINDGVTPVSIQELPGDPLIYTELYDDRSGDWFEVKEREIAVIPHAANDVVLWIDLQGQGDGGVRAFQ